jgi:hypothetical protein
LTSIIIIIISYSYLSLSFSYLSAETGWPSGHAFLNSKFLTMCMQTTAVQAKASSGVGPNGVWCMTRCCSYCLRSKAYGTFCHMYSSVQGAPGALTHSGAMTETCETWRVWERTGRSRVSHYTWNFKRAQISVQSPKTAQKGSKEHILTKRAQFARTCAI